MAHELAHVRQQALIGPRLQRDPDGTDPNMSTAGTTVSPNLFVCLKPEEPPEAPVSLPTSVEFEIPAVDKTGALSGTRKRPVSFDDEVTETAPIVLYAVPRRSIVELLQPMYGGTLNADDLTDDDLALAIGLTPPGAAPPNTFGPFVTMPPPFIGPPPAPETTRPPAPAIGPADLGPIALRGDYVITTHYSALAVGAGSVRIVRTQSGGITLLDAGVGPHAHAELTEVALTEINRLIGGGPITEVLLSHLHEDHTSLLPELAKKYRIGKIRVNAFQLADDRMVEVLTAVARNQAELIAEEVRNQANADRSAWETREGLVEVDATTRAARWDTHVNELVRVERAKAAIKLEKLFVDAHGEMHVVDAPLIGELVIPESPKSPVLLERGFLESDAATGGPRVSTARPKIAVDLDELSRKQAEAAAKDPNARVRERNEAIDANETTSVIELGGGARLFVSPDKRGHDLASMTEILKNDVARLNKELARLGREPAKLAIWDMSHHGQKGFVTTVTEMEAMIKSLQSLTRVKQASGARSVDIVIVSGHGDPKNAGAGSLIDPTTVWLLKEMGVEVYVATERSVEVLEVLLSEGHVVAGVSEGTPYETGLPSEGTLRQSQATLDFLNEQIKDLKASRPKAKGKKRADYLQEARAHSEKIAGLVKLRDSIELARRGYLEHYEAKRHAPARTAGAPPVEDTVGTAKRKALTDLLADERVRDVAAAEPRAETSVFDPVALALLKRPPGGYSSEQQSLVDAFVRADELRAKLAAPHGFEDRARLVAELSTLQPQLEAYAEKAPPGTKDLLQKEIELIKGEISTLTTPEPGGGGVASTTAADGSYSIEQRTQFKKGETTAADRIRQLGDLTTRPLGAMMIYSLVRKQAALQQGADNDTVDLPEYLIGTMHTAYGVSIGVKMLQKVHISNTSFAILAVIDVMETATRSYATDAQRNAAITYSIIKGGLEVGINVVGGAMMRAKNPYVVAAGLLMQFAVDPFLDWIGLYAWLEKKWDFLPDNVVAARQELGKLMQDYAVLVGLLELAARPETNLASMQAGKGDAGAKIKSEISDYRRKVIDKEYDLLRAFRTAYDTVKTSYAGLVDLDLMRQQFLQLQFRAHRGDTEHGVESRRQILDMFETIEGSISLDGVSAEAIKGMKQWSELDDKLDAYEGLLKFLGGNFPDTLDWKKVAKGQNEIQQMLDNAHYRLHPVPLGVRQAPLLSPSTLSRSVYEEELDKRQRRADRIHERMLGIPARSGAGGGDPLGPALVHASLVLAAYRTLRKSVPPLVGLTAARLQQNSYDAGKRYGDYLDDNDDYRNAVYKLQIAERTLQAAVNRVDELAMPETTAPVSSPIKARIQEIHDEAQKEMAERVAHGILFPDEATARVQEIRRKENIDIAKRLGQQDPNALSVTERSAIVRRDLPLSRTSTLVDRLAAIPLLSRTDEQGYMVGIRRYVDKRVPASANALVGDLRKTTKVTTLTSDAKVKVNIYVPITDAANALHDRGHGWFQIKGLVGPNPFEDLPEGTLIFEDDEVKEKLKRVKLEELKP